MYPYVCCCAVGANEYVFAGMESNARINRPANSAEMERKESVMAEAGRS